jgi:hypothetical protein
MTFSRFLSAAALSLTLLWAPSAHADTPPFFPVQGVLTDADGAALDGSVSVRFALYDALDATAALWEETRTLDVTAGAFTTYLGESVDLAPGVFRDQGSLWLGVTVESDEEMERVELGSAAYAAVAQHALEVPADVVRGDQSCGAGEVVSGLDAGGAVVCVADADADTVYSGADFALADQSCGPGDVVAGVDAAGDVVCVADADEDTTYTGVDFALSDQLCLPGEVVQGVDANGLTICVLDADSQYSGANFATSAQQCATGNVVLGVDTSGVVVCVSDSNTTYSGVDFALSSQSCTGTDLAVGFDGSGVLQCVSTVPWASLTGVPGDLADGDQDTQLTEAQVDGYVANNNYSTGSHTVVNGQPITPSSVGISGTSTSLAGGSLDLGPSTDDELTAAMVTTLTGGGTADALHSHAAQAATGAATIMSAESTTTMNFGDAMRYCRDLTEGGFSDWSLPSMDELWTVYETAVVSNDLSSTDVWTSTNSDGAHAHKRHVRFSDGYQWYMHTTTGFLAVRCVR